MNYNLYIYLFLVNEEFCIISWCRCRGFFPLSPLLLICDEEKYRCHDLIQVLWRNYLHLGLLQVNPENNVSKILALQRLLMSIIKGVTNVTFKYSWKDVIKMFQNNQYFLFIDRLYIRVIKIIAVNRSRTMNQWNLCIP